MSSNSTPTVHDLIGRLRKVERLDAVAGCVTSLSQAVYGKRPQLRKFMQGDGTLGGPLHPALVHLPIGAAFTAAALDAVGLKAAAGVATGLTVAGAVPSVCAGLADSEFFHGTQIKRVVAAHFLAAAKGNALAAVSLGARVAGKPGLARVALWGCCLSYAAAGAIGGYLAFAPSQPAPKHSEQDATSGSSAGEQDAASGSSAGEQDAASGSAGKATPSQPAPADGEHAPTS